MSHEITERYDGFAEAVFAERPAWHGLGTVVRDAPSSAEAIKVAGLDWSVVQSPVYTVAELPGQDAKRIVLEDHAANLRSDNGFCLGVVGSKYQVVNNRDAFDFMDSLYADGILKYESAFSLSGGRKVCLLARRPQVDSIADGDQIGRYLLFSTAHDGTGSIKITPTAVRVVCANTLALALGTARKNTVLSLRHSGNMTQKLAQARKHIQSTDKAFESFAAQAQRLAEAKATRDDVKEYIDAVYPLPDQDRKRSYNRAMRDRRKIAYNFFSDAKQQHAGVGGTWWAALNAVTQFVDHTERRGRGATAKSESRWNATQNGQGAALKQKAHETAVQMAGV